MTIDTDKLRTKFSRAVRRRDAGRAEVEAATEELGELFAQAIHAEAGLVKALAEEAGITRPTAYALARRPGAAVQEEKGS